MSINSITSVSLYEYYYQINHKEKKDTKSARELKKLESVQSDNDTKKTAEAKDTQKPNKEDIPQKQELSFNERPWADIMQQLGIGFNNDPKDDIREIKSALDKLTQGIDDDELLADIKDLDDYIKSMYITYYKDGFDSKKVSSSLSKELDGISAINKAFAF